MKKLLLLGIVTSAVLSSCSKSSSSKPAPSKPTTPTIPTFAVSTFAGGGSEASTDGTGTNAEFYQIIKLSSDAAGNIYVLEAVNSTTNIFYKVRKVTPDGTTTTLFNGGAETFVNNVPVYKVKIYRLIDITVDPTGNVYVQANMTDYSTVSNTQQSYYQELGLYKVNTATNGLDAISVSSTTATSAETTWSAAYNLIDNIAADASGNVYGAYSPGNTTGIPTGGKIYKITSGGGALLSDVDNEYPSSLYAEGNGTIYINTSTGVTSVTGTQQTNTIYTFPFPSTATPSILLGNQSGTLYEYSGIYDSSKVLKGDGFYKLTSSGTSTNIGVFSNDPIILASTADDSGNIYYAIHLPSANGGGYTIQKITVN